MPISFVFGSSENQTALESKKKSCSTCGLSLDRDVNAARNLAQLAVTHSRVTANGVTDAGEASSTKTCNVEGLVPTSVDAAALKALAESFEATRPLTLV